MKNTMEFDEFDLFLNELYEKAEEECLYLTFSKLIELRAGILEKLVKYEETFSLEVSEFDFEYAYPRPDAMYCINLLKLDLLSKLIYHKHCSVIAYKNIQYGNFFNYDTDSSKIIEMIKKNPKISYIEIVNEDIRFKIALDILIEKGEIRRVGEKRNSYWKINKTILPIT